MKHDATTETGTFIAGDHAALVIDPDGEFRLLLPNVPEDSAASLGHMLITAIAVKIMDPKWVDEIMQVLEDARRNLG